MSRSWINRIRFNDRIIMRLLINDIQFKCCFLPNYMNCFLPQISFSCLFKFTYIFELLLLYYSLLYFWRNLVWTRATAIEVWVVHILKYWQNLANNRTSRLPFKSVFLYLNYEGGNLLLRLHNAPFHMIAWVALWMI